MPIIFMQIVLSVKNMYLIEVILAGTLEVVILNPGYGQKNQEICFSSSLLFFQNVHYDCCVYV